jgi:hypothetical protein
MLKGRPEALGPIEATRELGRALRPEQQGVVLARG